jgi:hypothetical protein
MDTRWLTNNYITLVWHVPESLKTYLGSGKHIWLRDTAREKPEKGPKTINIKILTSQISDPPSLLVGVPEFAGENLLIPTTSSVTCNIGQ